ncbi:uncharacterized protein LOC119587410 [Penaeus monodon]|uniref:uncharacterized protein LOC119587410 n=1 Tax=Penaeus monodon TaxID=6687 RepID=UPI0018A6D620|nr:uncharacterized protein LOC119587410 [Penaeus monodon]
MHVHIVQNVDVIQQVNAGSDQRLVRGTIRLNTRLERSQMVRQRMFKDNIEALMTKEVQLQLKLHNCFMILSSQEEAEKVTEAIQVCAAETAGKNKEDKPKLKTKEIMKKRREMAGKNLTAGEKIDLCKTIRKRIREDLGEHNTLRVKRAITSGKGSKKATNSE